MDAAAELGRNPVSKHQIQPECGDKQGPSRETKFSGANADRGLFIFPVQPTTCRIGNLHPVDPYSCYMCDHTYIHGARAERVYSVCYL